jgi:hypothetical protein
MRRIGEKRAPGPSDGYEADMTAASTRHRAGRPEQPMVGLLVLIASLFTALICLGLAIVWLIDEDRDPGRWLIVMPVVAVAALAASAFADTTWSVRRTRTTELGNTTRLVAIGAVLLSVPSLLIAFAGEDDEAGGSRSIDPACPDGEVPDASFVDVLPDSTHSRAVNCLAWWGVVSTSGETFGPSSTVTRAQMASILDNLAAAAGAPLPEVDATRFADTADDVHAGAIARVAAADIMGGTGEDTFGPGGILSRGQLAALVNRTHDHVTGERLPAAGDDQDAVFDDIEASVHADNIRDTAAAGIVAGRNGSYSPGEPVTRAQMATVLTRLLALLVEEGEAELPA